RLRSPRRRLVRLHLPDLALARDAASRRAGRRIVLAFQGTRAGFAALGRRSLLLVHGVRHVAAPIPRRDALSRRETGELDVQCNPMKLQVYVERSHGAMRALNVNEKFNVPPTSNTAGPGGATRCFRGFAESRLARAFAPRRRCPKTIPSSRD